jgi:hypothetical protein
MIRERILTISTLLAFVVLSCRADTHTQGLLGQRGWSFEPDQADRA